MILAALLLAAIPHSDVVRDECDVIELNHLYDENGRSGLSQFIFYDWHERESRHHVVEWATTRTERKAKAGILPEEFKKRYRHELAAMVRPTKEGWRLRFDHMGVVREITARQFRETWTQFDPEIMERENLPKERRRGLSKPLRVPVLISGERSVLR